MPTTVRITLFFALACALTWWPFVVPGFAPDGHATNFALGPLIAAPIVILATEGGTGLIAWLKRIARFRAPLWVYATAFFGPLGIAALSTVFAIAIGTPAGRAADLRSRRSCLLSRHRAHRRPAAGRSHLPRLRSARGAQQTMSPFIASLWIGLGVVVWHLPLFISGEDPSLIAVAGDGGERRLCVALSWPARACGRVVIVHFTHNYLGAGFFQEVFAAPKPPSPSSPS